MSSPYPIDIGIQKLLTTAMGTSVTVSKMDFLPALDLKSTSAGYVYYDINECTPLHSSEGMAEANDAEVMEFNLDVACVAHSNTQRKALVTSVLGVLQPIVAGRRTQLTSYNVTDTDVFINFLRLESQEEVSSLKTGQSNPDLTILVLSFSGKATC